MSVKIWDAVTGAWKDAETMQRYDASMQAYKECASAKRQTDGIWKKVWPDRPETLYLYKDGDECIDVTGGWQSTGSTVSITKYSNCMRIIRNGVYNSVKTACKINLLPYHYIYAQYEGKTIPTVIARLYIYDNDFDEYIVKADSIDGNGTLKVDISGVKNSYYVGVSLVNADNCSMDIESVWLEK